MTDTSPIIVGLQSPGPAKQIHEHISSNVLLFQWFLEKLLIKFLDYRPSGRGSG
mgnify:CR=1 FL=1